jgi:hypothetical protein
MFKLPYERKEVLMKEIQDFIAHLKITKLSDKADRYYRKELQKNPDADGNAQYNIISKKTDDQKFPGYETILDYVSKSQKTEIFVERLQTSVEQIRKHLHEERRQNYYYDVSNLKNDAKPLDGALIKALALLGEAIELDEINYLDPKVAYSETPNEELIGIADQILDDLMTLSEKIRKFIRQYNTYGTAYQFKPEKRFKRSKEKNDLQDLENCRLEVRNVLNKKYVVDLFEDGTAEIQEMLQALWNAVEGLLTVPVRKSTYIYSFEDGAIVTGGSFKEKILSDVAKRYAKTDEIIFAYDFLENKTEEELFDLYKQMIQLDTFGFMGVNREGLLTIGESENKLNDLIGLAPVKESIRKIKAYAIANKENAALNLHMCFYGNPGTGKTKVARIIAGILYENKILPTKKVVEVDRGGLIGQYVGETPLKTMSKIHEAMGGVLFIDEA